MSRTKPAPEAPIEVVFSFDTTGSMYPCLTQLRHNLKETMTRLYREVPGIRMGLIAHGDYSDAGKTYVTKTRPLTNQLIDLHTFVEEVGPTDGGDAPECYELVLNEARSLGWSAGKKKVLVMIGDDIPHTPTYAGNTRKLNWRNELGLLIEAGISVHGVHCLPGVRAHSKPFYEAIASMTGGFYMALEQFASITDLVLAICYGAHNQASVATFEKEVLKAGRMNRGMLNTFDKLMKRAPSATAPIDLEAVPSGRFQVMKVDSDQRIDDFVARNGLSFRVGRGFYEFTKRVLVQDHKEVVLMSKKTGDMYHGDKARQIAGIPIGTTAWVKPGEGHLGEYACFIQSTSANRKLLDGTHFLYDVV